MSYQIEILTVPNKASQGEWIPMRSARAPNAPYQWPTYEEATRAMRNLYKGVLDEGSVRVSRIRSGGSL